MKSTAITEKAKREPKIMPKYFQSLRKSGTKKLNRKVVKEYEGDKVLTLLPSGD
jgi:hypothetical protein